MGRYWRFETAEVEAGEGKTRKVDPDRVRRAEGERLLARIPDGGPVVALTRGGKSLTSRDLAELDKDFVAAGWPHVLDLTNLQSADAAGVDRLRELISHGTRVEGISPYLQLLLEDSQ